ncbi:unnamed protein product [marine sediment metagenome]|uniref:Uncharacterized protein n=1 Tax=marine sediment metagenome TaxID=412755 RepID=X1GJT8_9ZZZZ
MNSGEGVLISQPKEINKVYDNLPEKDKKSIENRDNNNQD